MRLWPLLALLVLTGCATIASLENKREPKIFGGVRFHVKYPEFSLPTCGPCPNPGCMFSMIDFPLSLALDTALLPFTVVWELFRTSPTPPPRN